jgi:hypothetical protein
MARVMKKLHRCFSLHAVELTEHHTRLALSVFLLSYLAEEDEMRPLQGLGDPSGVNDAAEGCTQVHHGNIHGVSLWEWSILLLRRRAFQQEALGARRVAALLVSQGHHFNHGAKIAAFAAAQTSVAERVEDVSHLLRERLGDIEMMAADVEEGAAIAEAIPKAGEVVGDAVKGAEPPDEAGGDPCAMSR